MQAIALLRGINVGGKAVLPMRELAALFAEAGATDVRTYIQSGNVIFTSAEPEACAARVTQQIAQRFRYPGRIVLRSAAELREALGGNPFLKAGAAESTLHVYFLADRPAKAAVKALDPERSAPDAFVVRGRDIYLHLPDGMARTKLTNAYFEKALSTFATARNWKTLRKLVELTEVRAP